MTTKPPGRSIRDRFRRRALLRTLLPLALPIALPLALTACSEPTQVDDPSQPLPQSWFDNYTDVYLSDTVEVVVEGQANARSFPTGRGDTLQGHFNDGDRLSGRWVQGADPTQAWLLTDNGYYVWQGNLVGPGPVPGYNAAADQAAAEAADAAAAGAEAPSMEEASETIAADEPPPAADEPSPADRLASEMDDRLDRTAPDRATADRVRANLGHVVYETRGERSLRWAMCADNCADGFQSTQIEQPGRLGLLCIYRATDGRGAAIWYRGGREVRRLEDYCPSSLTAVDLPD